ncbi:TetR/AcrR family transcriptional regulator [Roseiterribacter gracilis]
MATSTPDKKLTEADWIRAATQILVRKSIEHVRVEPLAKELGVTKGSFYYHFRDREALLTEILNGWAERATVNLIERIDSTQPDPIARLRSVLDLPRRSRSAAQGGEIEVAIRAWARRAPLARKAVNRVDELRLEYFQRLLVEAGLDAETARTRAFLAYAYVQFAAQLKSGDDSEYEARLEEALRLLTTAAPSSAAMPRTARSR